MGFAKEIEDFLNGYQMVTKLGQDREELNLRREAVKRDIEDREEKKMNELAVDHSTYLPKKTGKVTSATPAGGVPDVTDPYAYMDEETGVSMAAGGRVPTKAELEEIEQGKRAGAAVGAAYGTKAAIPMPKAQPPVPRPREEGQAARQREAIPVTSRGKIPRPDELANQDEDPGRAAMRMQGHTPSTGPGLKDVFASSTKAIQAAMQGFIADSKQPKQAIGGSDPEVDFLTGKGAATPQEIKAIDTKIDPNGEMTPWDRGRARLGYAYNYFIERGEPEKATNVAKRLVLFDKMASQARGKIAGQLISSGNVAKGAEVLKDAYNENIHDGQLLDIKPAPNGGITFRVTDEDGNLVQEGTGTVADLAALAGNAASGSEFVERVSNLAPADDGAAPSAGQPAAAPTTTATSAAAPKQAIPATPAAGAEEGQQSTRPVAAKAPRDITWAMDSYERAARVYRTWADEVEKNPSAENKARLKDAEIRLKEAGDNAYAIRTSTASKNADKGNIRLQLRKDLKSIVDAADPFDELPAMPPDGLRGQPKGEGVTAAGNPEKPKSSRLGARVSGKKSGEIAQYTIPGVDGVIEGPWQNLNPVPPELAAEVEKGVAAGKDKAGMLRKLLDSGYDPTGL